MDACASSMLQWGEEERGEERREGEGERGERGERGGERGDGRGKRGGEEEEESTSRMLL